MKIRSRIPWGYRVLGLVALSGLSLAVQAEDKIVLLTSGTPRRSRAAIIRPRQRGSTKIWSGCRHSLRRPQVNGMQLLLSKRADVIIGYDLQLLEGIQRGFRPKPLPPLSV